MLCTSTVVGDQDCTASCAWNEWQDYTQCSQQCGPRGLQVQIRDGVDPKPTDPNEVVCSCSEEESFRMQACNRVCLNGGQVEMVDGDLICVCSTGFHGECCEHGHDLTVFVVVYVVIILLCFVFVCSMFCVGEYRHKHVLQAIPTTYETEFDDWEEEKPLLEPKFVWTAPHDTKKMGLFYKSWDTYSEYSSRAGSVMSVGSFSFEMDDESGEKTFKGHDAVLERLDIFEIAMLRNFGDLDRETRMTLVQKIAPRIDFEEQIKLRSYDSLSEEEGMEMISRLMSLADTADMIKEQERKELKELEEHPTFDDIDSDIVEMMGRFDELTEEERERVIEQLEDILSEKDKIKLRNFDQLSSREQDSLLARLGKLQEVARKVEAKKLAEAPDDDGKIELTTSMVTEGMITVASLRTAIKSDAMRDILKMVGMSIGGLSHRPDARLEIRARVLAKLLLLSEEEVTQLCLRDGITQEQLDEMSHVERIAHIADRAAAACVADVALVETEQKEEEARIAEEQRRLRELGETSTISSMSGVMSMSSSDDDDDNAGKPRRVKKVDLSKIKWSGPPKGAKPGFNRGMLSLGVLSTSVKKFKERERTGIIQGRGNIRSQALSERLVKSLSNRSVEVPDLNIKQSLRQRLSHQPDGGGLEEEGYDTSSMSEQ